MVRLNQMPEPSRSHLAALPCPSYPDRPWVEGPPLPQRRLALVSTAGLHRRQDPPFSGLTGDYRVIPGEVPVGELVMSHLSSNFDRSGFMDDANLVFPLDRLRDLVQEGFIGSLARFHYSFMGASNPRLMEAAAREVAGLLHGDGVTAVLLVPV